MPLSRVTGETADISEHLDFGFHDCVWCKDNAGLSPPHPVQWLGASESMGRLMLHLALTQKGEVFSRSAAQRVTNLESQTDNAKDAFNEFDDKTHQKLKTSHRGCEGAKPNPED